MIKAKKGFTVLELMLVVLIFGAATVFFFMQKANIDAMRRDEHSRVAINAMYYSLEEVFYPEHGYYPMTISEDNLRAIDPQLFTDPYGFNIGDNASSFRYEPTDCTNDRCQGFTLRAILEREDDFIRQSRH